MRSFQGREMEIQKDPKDAKLHPFQGFILSVIVVPYCTLYSQYYCIVHMRTYAPPTCAKLLVMLFESPLFCVLRTQMLCMLKDDGYFSITACLPFINPVKPNAFLQGLHHK